MTLSCLPASGGISLSPGTTPWVFTSYQIAATSTLAYNVLGFTYIFESSGALTNNVIHEIEFEWSINNSSVGGVRTVIATVPVTVMRASGAESQWPEQQIRFVVPVITAAFGNKTLEVRAATGSAFGTTMSGIKAIVDI